MIYSRWQCPWPWRPREMQVVARRKRGLHQICHGTFSWSWKKWKPSCKMTLCAVNLMWKYILLDLGCRVDAYQHIASWFSFKMNHLNLIQLLNLHHVMRKAPACTFALTENPGFQKQNKHFILFFDASKLIKKNVVWLRLLRRAKGISPDW